MTSTKKIIRAGVISLLMLASLNATPLIQPAQKAEAFHSDATIFTDRDDGFTNFRRRTRDRFFQGPVVVVRTNRGFFERHNLFRRFPVFRRYLPDQIFPRRVIITDRTNDRDSIRFRNFITGPFSVNEVRVRVDRDFFNRLVDEVSINNDVDIRVDTGNNTVSFNTIAGSIQTGDVDISVGL